MLTNDRIRDLRQHAGLRQEDMAFLLGVGIASINRWEKAGNSLPTGLVRQVLDVLDTLDRTGHPLDDVAARLRAEGSFATVRWLLNELHRVQGGM